MSSSSCNLHSLTFIIFTVSPFYATSPSASPSSVMYGNETFITSPSYMAQHGPGSPDSLMSGFSVTQPVYHHPQVPPQLVQSSSSSTIHSTSSASSAAATAYLNETIAKASALPESFYPEFLQYSKESFEQSASNSNNSNSKKRSRSDEDKGQQQQQFSSSSSSSSEEDDDEERRPARKQKVE